MRIKIESKDIREIVIRGNSRKFEQMYNIIE